MNNRNVTITVIIVTIIIATLACSSTSSNNGESPAIILPTATPDIKTYLEIDVRELESYAKNYEGVKVQLTGEVFNIGDGYIQMHVVKPGDNKWDTTEVYVTYKENILPKGVYEDTNVTVYGVGKGEATGINAFGGIISQPKINADIIKIVNMELEETRSITDTISGANTSEPTPTVDTKEVLAKNFVANYEENGAIVEVGRILICESNWNTVRKNFSDVDIIQDKTTYIEIIYRITNNTEESFYVLGTELAGSFNGEQIEFSEFYWETRMGDKLIYPILPGSIVVGGIWVGINRSTFDEIEKIILSIPGIVDTDYDNVTDDILFTIDVENWEFEPYPTELEMGKGNFYK